MSESRGRADDKQDIQPVRRQMERAPIQVLLALASGRDRTLHATLDLSSGGCLAEAVPYPVGTQLAVRIELPLEPNPIDCAGEVVWTLTANKLGMGIKFKDLGPHDARRIENFTSLAERLSP